MSVLASISEAIRSLLAKSPPHAIGFLLLNGIFVVGFTWLALAQNAARERVLTQLVISCMQRK